MTASPPAAPFPAPGSTGVVLQLISSLQVGGAERLLVDFLASAAAQRAVAQALVVINDEIDAGLAQAVTQTGLPAYYLGRRRGDKDPRYLLKLLRVIRRHRVAVVHAHNDAAKFWAFACKARFPHLRIVYTVHQNEEVGRAGRLHGVLHRRLVDCTIAISDAVLAECAAAGFARTVRLYNGIPLARFRRSAPPRAFATPLRLINVARLDHAIKGQDILIRAVRRCRDAGLDVTARFVGTASADRAGSYPALLRLVEELGLVGRVEFLQHRSDVPDLLADADIFVLPSRREGFGLVLLEAMAAGLPVIAADIPGPAELVAPGVTGLRFAAGSDADLADKIRALAADPDKAALLATRAAAFAEAFDIGRMRERYYDVYSRVMRRQPVPQPVT